MAATNQAKAAAFRALAHSRRSSRRFQPNRKIPDETLRDILETTIVSLYDGFLSMCNGFSAVLALLPTQYFCFNYILRL